MTHDDSNALLAPYLQLAEELFQDPDNQLLLAQAARTLPALTRALLDHLVAAATEQALRQPRRGWALLAVAHAANKASTGDGAAAHFLSGLTAWHLARMANEWVRPERVDAAVCAARRHFLAAGAEDWVVACDWQQNALPWTQNDLAGALSTLEAAFAHLQDAESFAPFLPALHLSLSNAYLVNGRPEMAGPHVEAALATFQANGDEGNLGRALVEKANYLLRRYDFEAARVTATRALGLFDEGEEPVDVARARYRRGLICAIWGKVGPEVENDLLSAAATFAAADLPLWVGQAYNILAFYYRYHGQLVAAEDALGRAREVYAEFNVLGLRADNLLDNGKFHLQKGDYQRGLDYLVEAEALYRRVQATMMVSVSQMYQGEAYAVLGRYQQALRSLESAYAGLEHTDSPRHMECATRLADVWLELNRPDTALAYQTGTLEFFRGKNHPPYLAHLARARADALFRQGQAEEAVRFLRQLLEEIPADAEKPTMPRLHLLLALGQLLDALDQYQTALSHLSQADEGLKRLGSIADKARCQVALGNCYRNLERGEAAEAAWQEALHLSGESLPNVTWEAWIGLARLAEAQGEDGLALQRYRQAVEALSRARRWLWQPAVAGSYLQQPARTLDAAVALAARQEAHALALSFIEESKAQAVTHRFAVPPHGRFTSTDSGRQLRDLAAEIRWLQAELDARAQQRTVPLQADAGETLLFRQLQEKAHTYNRLMEANEREESTDAVAPPPITFSLSHFRRTASTKLGEDWVALNYYLTREAAYCTLLTASECRVFRCPLEGAARIAFHIFRRNLHKAEVQSLQQRDLASLGQWLLPAPVRERLQPATSLIIVPHRDLHHLPWAALTLPGDGIPLVAAAKPVVVPGLRSLLALWQRPQDTRPQRRAGVVIAVSEFEGRWEPLPAARTEARILAEQMGDEGTHLVDAQAKWEKVAGLAGAEGLARFSFLHVASHAFQADRRSGFVLQDREVWLDELWEWAPLPALVTLSACSGTRSHLYAGDEHMSLPGTCLAAGARQVVGSLWPVQDEAAAQLMDTFYSHYFSGKPVAEALALAQRQAWEQEVTLHKWAPFITIGTPGS